MKCKNINCTKSFHACSSCSLSYDWEYSFCSEKCYLEHNKELINKINQFIYSLTIEQQKFMKYCINEVDSELLNIVINKEIK